MTEKPGPTRIPHNSVISEDEAPRGAAGAPESLQPEFLDRVRHRDRSALEEFFERYFDVVHGFVRRFVGESTQAEDITQDVFVKVYNGIESLDPARDPRAWLHAIALNSCRDHWRSRDHRMRRSSASLDAHPALEAGLAARDGDPAERHARREREQRVQQAIQGLEAPLREAVLLRDYAGLSHAEAAEILGLSEAAARKRYSRALRALAGLLHGVIE